MNYFKAHEDAIFGFSEAKSAKKNEDLGLLVMPKIFQEHLPVPIHILRRELGIFNLQNNFCLPLYRC